MALHLHHLFLLKVFYFVGKNYDVFARTSAGKTFYTPVLAIVMEDPDGNKIEGPEFKVVPAEKDIADFAKNEFWFGI